MDLNVLFATQVERLKECYAELGHAPNRLQLALQAAVDGEVERSGREIEEAKEQVALLSKQCESYRGVLGETGSASTSLHAPVTLLASIEHKQAELDRLQSIYASRKSQVDKLLARIDEYRALLGDLVPPVDAPSNGVDVESLPKLSDLQATLSWCADEVRRRSSELEETLIAISQLWSDLWEAPDHSDAFDSMVLLHLGIRPLLVDLGQGRMEFAGGFEQAEENNSAPLEATPTRKSGSERELSTVVGGVQRLHKMAPTLDNIAKAADRMGALDAEKERRFALIQRLFDELSLLWKRFDVADEAVDEFVQENTGCTMAAVHTYERELKQMRDLKAEHMTLFISKVREDIASLWDQLLMTEAERRASLPDFFEDLNDAEGGAGVEPSDELLALHEEKVQELSEEVRVKARPLELVRQYTRLLEEAQELEASAKDTSRLMARGAGQKRDPGRLLREEKMRKRIKVLKPKIEDELLRLIPAWEDESGRSFCIHGQRFLDSFDVQPRSPKKRPRTVSSATAPSIAAATPQMPAIKRSRIESAQSVRRAAATPQSVQPPSSSKPSHIPRPGISRPVVGTHAALQAVDTNRIPSNSSNGSSSSRATDQTTIIHKPVKVKRRGPSLLLEESLRHATTSKSAFARPASTGAGASVRPVSDYPSKAARFMAANESIGGPNWAVLDEGEESNLLS